MLPIDDAETLPKLYHYNSEPWLNLEAYNDPSNEMRFRELEGDYPVVALPPPNGESPLFQLLQKRCSCRQFVRATLALTQISQILAGAYGITQTNLLQNGALVCSRPVPSAGGLYSLEIYAAIQNVENLADGIYRYNTLYHSLEQMQSAPIVNQIGSIMLEQQFLENASAIFFITADFSTTLKKYGARGYRYLLFEAGHCAQNICLLATENQLASLCVGGFFDVQVNQLLLPQHEQIVALYCVAVGHANTSQMETNK